MKLGSGFSQRGSLQTVHREEWKHRKRTSGRVFQELATTMSAGAQRGHHTDPPLRRTCRRREAVNTQEFLEHHKTGRVWKLGGQSQGSAREHLSAGRTAVTWDVTVTGEVLALSFREKTCRGSPAPVMV